MLRVSLKAEEIYGREYKKIIQCRKRYLVIKGSRASKKSRNTALRWISLLYEYEESNLLVVRKYSTLLKQSCRAELIWAIKRLRVEQDWVIPKSELTLTRKSTGQVILFRGVNEPDGIASITVEHGVLNFAWIEEAYQLDEDDFNMIDEALRGQMSEGYFRQVVLTFNPWHESSWLRPRFFNLREGEESDNEVKYIPNRQKSTPTTLAVTRNYTCNEFLDKLDVANFERMRIEQPERYRIAGKGEWGVTGSTIYSNYQVKDFNWKLLYFEKDLYTGKPIYEHRIGLDFGYSHNTAGVRLLVNREKRELYVCEEFYGNRLSTDEIYKGLVELDWVKEPIHADSEAPQTIKDLSKLGCSRMFGVKKEQGSVFSGIQELRGYKIYIHTSCENFQIEIAHYHFKKNAGGKELPQPAKEWDHLMDAMRYAMIDDAAGIEFVPPPGIDAITISDEKRRYEAQLNRIRRGG